MRPQYQIKAQPTSAAYPNGEVNVRNFLKTHENEIKSLENAMRAAKKGLTRRAFQDVPRELRRRTASHNPQRVPKRLRVRAKQEAKDDNTPTSRGKSGSGIGKGKQKHLRKDGLEKSRAKWAKRAKTRKGYVSEDVMEMDTEPEKQVVTKKTTKPTTRAKPKPRFQALATPATPPSRFRRRQRDKTWLPTHVWHSKRARMTEPKESLWRFAIPLQPVVKAYRLTRRAATQRGAVAWDMSYMSTISLEGVDASIVGLLKSLHFASGEVENPWQDRGRAKKWRQGTRVWEGWIYEREAKPLKRIAPVTVIWCVAEAGETKRKLFMRVHPSAFLQLWNEVIRVSKVQKPLVTVEDLRFEVGSIEITGPAAAETLCSILSPSATTSAAPGTPVSTWPMLGSVADVGSLPLGALLAFDITDPRLRDPPATTELRQDEHSQNSLLEVLARWPVDGTQPASLLFDRDTRIAAQRMPSDKSINHRKSACTLGDYPEAKAGDPSIPMLLYVSRDSKSWTVLLPWKCVQPVWRGIMRYPVSTGSNPRFGGLKERRQVNFERSVPHFPYDMPGSDAGWLWELKERKTREHDWRKRPKGKRIEWSTIDLGNGVKGEMGDPWACDWARLLPKASITAEGAPANSGEACPILQLPSKQAREALGGEAPADEPLTPGVFTVKISMTQRGTPTDCARIYRLPSNNTKLRDQWLSLLRKPASKRQPRVQHNGYASDMPEHIKRRELARSLLKAPVANDDPPKAGEDGYPFTPAEEDLIGFVTTGNYNLAEGTPTAVANLALNRVLTGVPDGRALQKEGHMCIVRQAGSTIGRLATWEIV
jgi:ribonuclease P/MRP protein subunit POP1